MPGETPAVGPTYSEPIAQIVYETKSVVRLVGYHAGAFGETQSRLFKVGMATFYKVAPEHISISSVKDVVSSSSRRLLQTSAIDVNYTVTSTTIESVLEVANQTNSAVTTTQGEVYDDLRAAGLIISDAVILLEARTTEKASALAPSGPYDINVNLHLDVDVHVDNAPASREPTSSTPGGNPASSIISANNIAEIGAISDGLRIIVQPVERAGITFKAIWLIGQFQGVIKPQTPIGS